MDAPDDDPLPALRALFEDARAFGMDGWGTIEASADVVGPEVEAPAPEAEARTTPDVVATAAPSREALEDPIARLAADVDACRRCPLGHERARCVPGVGARADFLFVGPGPSADDEAEGRPFAGAEGELLGKMIAAMGLASGDVFLTHVVKCRPSDGREATASEAAACVDFLRREFSAARPRVVVAFGERAARRLLKSDAPWTELRGKAHPLGGASCVVTHRPSDLLASPALKAAAWEDLKLALRCANREPPPRP